MFTRISNFLRGTKKDDKAAQKPMPNMDDVFDIERFNKWFCDPENGAVYANAGIFLRTDKLSESQIEDYMEKCWNMFPSTEDEQRMTKFYWEIRTDWMKKARNK